MASEQLPSVYPFDFEGAAVRVATEAGEPWFVLADVCRVLEIENSRNAAARLDDDEKGVRTMDTPSGAQQMTIINESGLYSLILTSRKAAAKRFKKWVTAEVLPAIRKNGGYVAGQEKVATGEMSADELMARAVLMADATIKDLTRKVAALAPKADAHDRIAEADGSLCITDAAKTLQVRPKELFAYLRANGWIYSRPGSSDIGRQERINAGLLAHKVTAVSRPDGTEKVATQVRVTPKGLARLAVAFSPTLQMSA
ncbi:phage antirepressor KilAC domain-containing protein [Roseomonas chloroacetimidivorans]|uniref:phage antirepressor KilAC domain-containing protein n=1 Tax=Roseomonas chloroacetimidivorans TaxID=1766656 RepID=UPI003C756939